jgi:RNA polymerase sigma factor (sigma-70 family)
MLEAAFRQAYPLALRSARVRSAAAVVSGDVLRSEHEDLEQEGLMACWRALPHYDPTRASLRTFVESVVARHFVSLHRARLCRPRFQPVHESQHLVGTDWAHKIELRSDVQRVLNTLPDAEQQLAVALIERTPTEVSRLVGIARSTVYERIRHIRTVFSDSGLRPRALRR